jgi:GTP-binding protein EngB required for normal cell division
MLNESQQRYVVARLRHVEELLGDALAGLMVGDNARLFPRLIPDATASQRKIVHDYLKQLSFATQQFLNSQSLRDTVAPISGLWSFQTALTFALIAVEELRPRYLQGYGELDPMAAIAVEQFSAEAQTLLRRISRYLTSGTGGDLASRLAQLDATREEIALLRELEHVISAQGLVELRATLQDLIERASESRLEFAVFGRVNAGKSSLLNWWLDGALLPTGITPVTAVPTRVAQGPPQAEVTLVGGQRVRIPIEDLPPYITEGGNPSNVKGVLEVFIRTPSERLRDGLVLVDTPGLSSLARAGAIQTLQYLPRCDFGVVLIEASAPITEEDLNVTRALLHNGSEVLITLSKADRLAAQDLSEALTYTETELRSRLEPTLSVSAISTIEPHSELTSAWFREHVEPRLVHLREEAARSLRRKISLLRDSAVAVLEARLQSASSVERPAAYGARAQERRERLAQARARLDEMQRELGSLVSAVRPHLDALLAAGAQALERSWLERQDRDATDVRVREAVMHRAHQIGQRLAQTLDELRLELQSMARAHAEEGSHEELPSPHGLPSGDFAFPETGLASRRPRGCLGFKPLLRMSARWRMQRGSSAILEGEFALYAEALRLWALRYVEELRAQFDKLVSRQEGVDRQRANHTSSGDELSDAAKSLYRLRHWSEGSAEMQRPIIQA